MNLESLDRRAFMQGLMCTSAGLLVPKPVMVAVPAKALAPWSPEMLDLVSEIRVLASGEWGWGGGALRREAQCWLSNRGLSW